jgi:hypothetical protein
MCQSWVWSHRGHIIMVRKFIQWTAEWSFALRFTTHFLSITSCFRAFCVFRSVQNGAMHLRWLSGVVDRKWRHYSIFLYRLNSGRPLTVCLFRALQKLSTLAIICHTDQILECFRAFAPECWVILFQRPKDTFLNALIRVVWTIIMHISAASGSIVIESEVNWI